MSKVLPDESSDAVYLDSGILGATELKSPPLGVYPGGNRVSETECRRGPSDGGPSVDSPTDHTTSFAADDRPSGSTASGSNSNGRVSIIRRHADGAAGGNSQPRATGGAASLAGPAGGGVEAVLPVEPTADYLSHAIPNLPTSVFYACSKRVIDVFGALVGLLLFSPVMLLCAIWIKLHDGGPIFFWQPRIGERGETFQIVKFRSMVVNAEAMKAALAELNAHDDDRTFKIFNDPRVTRVGRFMRRLSLDELPQFWNVLCGHMSLVGPRPALASEVAKYERSDLIRLAVKPGLTCIWQVSGRSRLDFCQQVALDLEYISRRSVMLDAKLILLTLPAVFLGDGAA